MTINYSELGIFEDIIKSEIEALNPSGILLFSLLEASETEFKITVSTNPYDEVSDFTGYNPDIKEIRINLDQFLNSQYETVVDADPSDRYYSRLGIDLFHEAGHAVADEFLSNWGDYLHDSCVNPHLGVRV